MYQTALLLITGPLRLISESLGKYLSSASQNVSKRLYVKLEPELSKPYSQSDVSTIGNISAVVPLIYHKATYILKSVDVRLLLSNKNVPKTDGLKFDVILTNSDAEDSNILQYLGCNHCKVVKLHCTDIEPSVDPQNSKADYQVYKTVCLGGTFDRIHNGHKVLLSEAVLRASEKLIVGVSDGDLLKKKVLSDLIEPVDKRIVDISDFLAEVDPRLCYDVVPILDPFGPTITDPDIDCIVVTSETKSGGLKVNSERINRGMKELDMYVVDVIEDSNHEVYEEEKLSSSNNRMRLLGMPLKHKEFETHPSRPHYILLQGFLMSNKSMIASGFQAKGLPVLCCDQIVFSLFQKDQQLKESVLETFPRLSHDFSMEEFAAECFKSEKNRQQISDGICSKLRTTLRQILDIYKDKGNCHTILIKDSTVFKEQCLPIEIDEMWAGIVPTLEFLDRVREEYKLEEKDISGIADFLKSNQVYINMSNIVFCISQSQKAVTIQEQVDRAWTYLKSQKSSAL